MIHLPLTYSGTTIGFARVDDNFNSLQNLITLGVRIPNRIKQMTGGNPDFFIALVREDKEVKKKLLPFITSMGTRIPLTHLVLSEEIRELVIEDNLNSRLRSKKDRRSILQRARILIGKVSHEDGDRTNCCRDNLLHTPPSPAGFEKEVIKAD